MRAFKPKGLTIYITRPNSRGDSFYQAGIKSKGRTGSKVRARFLRADRQTQANALHEWARGRAVTL